MDEQPEILLWKGVWATSRGQRIPGSLESLIDQQKLCDVCRLSSAKLKGKMKTETQWFTVSKHIWQLNLDPPTVSHLAD